MSIPTYNYVWQQGEDGNINMIYTIDDVLVDLTTFSLRMDIRNAAGTLLFVFNSDDIIETPSIDITGASDNEATLGNDGTINIVVPRSASLVGGKLQPEIGNTLYYDVFLRNAAGKQKKLLKGTVLVEASQTRWV